MNQFHRSSLNLLLHLQQKRQTESGYSLVVTVAAIVLLSSLLITAALVSKVDSASTDASRDSNSGFYAAEAGLSLRANDVRNTFLGFNRPSGDEPSSWESCIDSSDGNDGTDDFICDTSLTINNQQIVTYVNDVTEDTAIAVTIDGGPFDGLSAQEYRYDLISVALDEEGGQQSPTSILGMRFKSQLIPVFQFAAFFEQDLAFSIPPTMNINGRVHSNSDIYLNAGGGSNNLNINGRITSPGSLFRGEKVVSDDCRTNVLIIGDSLACGNGSSRREYSQDDLLATWGDNILINSEEYRLTLPEVSNFQVPPDSIISNADDREEYQYWENADMRVVLRLDNANNPTGVSIVNANGTTNNGATTSLNSCIPVSTTLTEESAGDSNYEITDVDLNVQVADNFSVGDRIIIGNDIDSNVILSKDDTSDRITIRRQLGHGYQSNPVASSTEVVRKAVVSTSNTFYNYREKNSTTGENAGRFIRMLDVDIQELIDCVNANVGGNGLMGNRALDDDTNGGLVWYFTIDGPDSEVNINDGDAPNNYGIRLYNAAELDASDAAAPNLRGLTIVSDQAVYTQGNYNSTNKIPAAIISDSYNVLSTAWNSDDSNSRLYNGSNLQDTSGNTRTDVFSFSTGDTGDIERDAGNTTINIALFNGQDFEGDGNGPGTQDDGIDTSSGGVNNYPRMHEDWLSSEICGSVGAPARCTLTYRGSMVSFGQAERVNGDFCGSGFDGGCNIYSPPIRDWSFDTDFSQAQNLPPLTPRVVFITQEVFERDFTRNASTNLSPIALFSFQLNSKKFTNQTPFLTSFHL